MSDYSRITRDGSVAVIRLNRPERRNAMVPELLTELEGQLRRCGRDSGLRAVVLTGEGPSFCVGADLKWLAAEPDPGEAIGRLIEAHHGVVLAMRRLPVTIVAAVNGAAAGGGLSLALAADYRVAASTATFTAAYFRLGLPPDGGNSAFLARQIGAARAMELLLTNRTLSAAEALAWGLVGEVVEAEALVERACVLAAEFSRAPGETLVATRRLLDSATAQPLEAQLEAEAAAMTAAARQPSFAAAVRAFLERPRPTRVAD